MTDDAEVVRFFQKRTVCCSENAMLRECLAQQKRPVWACDAGNIASQKLAEKLGFEKVSEYTAIRAAQQ